ncbi:hypothetical protein [Aurantiacibacter poecillastricola]|uniref:hypothetical protein n=1 Tax=Aurantiacibacter poecillastricola TaxID=3064385 RepID=UPI00273EF2F3|nr:hypothetical protein [Aurantiacibacter sp. 219JJ12-13]MDP5262439.1 hypothetical protein [Aurantiacibacter sp. 219JJ12-13]
MSKAPIIAGGVLLAGAALAVLVILPAETGWDPSGAGEALGLTEIAEPTNLELERGMARMENEEVLTVSQTALPASDGITDVWEYELLPFESVEFKYTMPEGEPMTFHWQGTDTLAYDMHAHPFDGGEEVTESYGVDEAREIYGRYTPAFTGIHGWFWENRTMDNVTLRLEASGGMTNATVFTSAGEFERPLEGAAEGPQGSVEGHEMQSAEDAPAT